MSVEVILASSSLKKRKRDKDTLAISSMATTPKRMLLQVNLGTSMSPFSPKIKVAQVRVSDGLCPDSSFFILLISSPFSSIPPNFFFLIYLIWTKGCCWLKFFSLRIHDVEKVGPASLYQWKTMVPLVAPLSRHFGLSSSERLRGFPLLRRKCSFLWGTGFSSNFISHCLFVERHRFGQWDVVSMKILLMLMRDSSLLLETSWTYERLVGWGSSEIMKTWNRERQQVGSCGKTIG